MVTEHQRRIEQFFQNEIRNYVLGDLDSMKELNKRERGWCAVPLGQLLFSVIDLFGFLIRPEQNALKKHTLHNIRALVCDVDLFPDSNYQPWADRLVTQFRHGLIHQFFPKASCIARLGESADLIMPGTGLVTLNVDRLEADLRRALSTLSNRALGVDGAALSERMSRRLDALAQDDWKEFPA